MARKTMQPNDYDRNKLKFPFGMQPKIDGVRGHNPEGTLLARSNKQFRNPYVQDMFSTPGYTGFDGEFAHGKWNDKRLVSATTSATSRSYGRPELDWWIFDYLIPETINLGYEARYIALQRRLSYLHEQGLCLNAKIVPMYMVTCIEEFDRLHEQFERDGFEGSIIRYLDGPHKEGRSTPNQRGVLRRKDFITEEAVVTRLIEAQENNNEQQTNELGRSFRSSHQENKVGKGMLGSFEARILKTSDLFKEGDVITVSRGEMTEEEAIEAWENPQMFLQKAITFKHFPKGVKNKPRFPTYVCLYTE